jgi:hypothetical protein
MPCFPIRPRMLARASSSPAEKMTIRAHRYVRICLAVAVVALLTQPALVSAQTVTTPAKDGTQESAAQRDGQRDFDWMIGTWKGRLKRLLNPLTGSTTWVEYNVTQVTRKVWGGRANMDEFTADSPETQSHIEGMTLRLYKPESREWYIYWANMKTGALGLPPTVGRFNNGRGEFYDHEEIGGRMIFVRYVWSDITPNSARFEQSFSADGGKTWEPNWISTITRVKE